MSLHRPCVQSSLNVTPQPVREAFIVSIMQQHDAPNTGLWDRKQGFLNMSKTQRHHYDRQILIDKSGYYSIEVGMEPK